MTIDNILINTINNGGKVLSCCGLLVLLGSCTITGPTQVTITSQQSIAVNTATSTDTITTTPLSTNDVTCAPYQLPEIPKLPNIPDITDLDLGNLDSIYQALTEQLRYTILAKETYEQLVMTLEETVQQHNRLCE